MTGMPRPKADFDDLYPCDFYTPEELLEDDLMYSVYEIARLLKTGCVADNDRLFVKPLNE